MKLHIRAAVETFLLATALITASSAALQAPLKIPARALKKTTLGEYFRKNEIMFMESVAFLRPCAITVDALDCPGVCGSCGKAVSVFSQDGRLPPDGSHPEYGGGTGCGPGSQSD
jgi:hypothetical protein